MKPTDPPRKRVLIVEDNVLILMIIQDMLEELGCTIAGTSGNLAQALDMARQMELDFAVLDLGLGDEASYPVADALTDRSIPFVISAGQSSTGIPERFAKTTMLRKPFIIDDLRQAVRTVLAR